MQSYFEAMYRGPFLPENVLVVVDGDKPVGVAHIFDAGLPWTIVDGYYLLPEYRSVENFHLLGYGVEAELKRRGIAFYTTSAAPQLAKVLERYEFHPINGELTLMGKVLA